MNKKNETILIVDDTQSNIDLLIELLSDYDIVVATDGQIALDILQEDDTIDLILLDIMMPNMNGFEVCEIIKKNPKINKIPIIFLTAKSDEESIKKGFDIGGVDYIIKPFRAIELFARIKTHLNLVKHEKKEIQNNKIIALKELIRNISHHWKQPLSAISVSASGMKLQKEIGNLNDENLYLYCDNILKSTKYLTSTIDSFEELMSKDEQEELFNLNELVQKNKDLFINKLENDTNKIFINIDQNIEIYGIKKELLQVIFHIIKNSKDILKKYKQGLIFLNGFKKDDFIVLNIYDNGGGIEKEIKDKIFDPYFTTKHKSFGTGLGLYSVYTIIVHSFNGNIKVSNIEFEYEQKEYKGANFEIQIPIN